MRKLSRLVYGLLMSLIWFAPTLAQTAGLTQEALANASYTGIYEEAVQLTDGVYEGEPFVAGISSRPRLEILDEVVYGDFDRNGSEDAAVLLVESSGGTGHFYYLAIVQQSEEGPENIATTWIGDRIDIEAFEVDENLNIDLTLLTMGQFDGACCPTLRLQQSFTWLNGELRQTFNRVLGSTADDPRPMSVEQIANATYTVASDPELELTLEAGQYRNEELFITATLSREPYFGDLNGDDLLDAVVIIEVSGGGSGVFRNLVAILNEGGDPKPIASVLLGDRAVIHSIAIVDGQILVDALVPGPNDVACCPTQALNAAYSLADTELIETPLNASIVTDLSSLTLPSTRVEGGEVTLADGRFDTEEIHVALSGYVAAGDLNGDGLDDAAAVIVSDPDGTARFYDLYALVREGDSYTPLAPVEIGDRVELQNLAVIDSEIRLEATVHGPDDANCCPTQAVERHYMVQEGALVQTSEELLHAVLYGAGGIVPGGTFAPDAEGQIVLNLGGTDTQWLDPSLVSALSGVVNGPAVDAQTLGAGCVGYIPATPDVVVNWSEDLDVKTLSIFVRSIGDPVLVIVTPAGDILCNDDYTPLVPDPYVEIPNPEAGRYAIFVGGFEDGALTPGFVVISGSGLNPVLFDPMLLFPPQLDRSRLRTAIPASAMLVDATPQITAEAPLASLSLPFTTTLVAGGELAAFNVELDNTQCTGFISGAPAFAFDWEGEREEITLMFEAAADTTLIVRDPLGNYLCNDDFSGATNLNPAQSLTPTVGQYWVWVGSYAPNVTIDGVFTIADGAVAPVALTAATSEE